MGVRWKGTEESVREGSKGVSQEAQRDTAEEGSGDREGDTDVSHRSQYNTAHSRTIHVFLFYVTCVMVCETIPVVMTAKKGNSTPVSNIVSKYP